MQTIESIDDLLDEIAGEFADMDWRPWLANSMRGIEAEHEVMFAEQRDPAFDDWVPLAPSTVRRKGNSTILVETGALKASLTKPGAGIREMFQEGENIGLVFGTDVPYSIYHIRGGPRLPIRDHVGLPLTRFEQFVGDACDHALAELKQ